MRSDWTVVRKTVGLSFIVAGLLWGFALQMRGDAGRVKSAGIAIAAQGSSENEAPTFQNGHLEKQTARGTLAEEVRSWSSGTTTARWLGYSVTEVEGDRAVCCSNWNESERQCGVCQLEGNRYGLNVNSNGAAEKSAVHLEGSRRLAVLIRAGEWEDREDSRVFGGLRRGCRREGSAVAGGSEGPRERGAAHGVRASGEVEWRR